MSPWRVGPSAKVSSTGTTEFESAMSTKTAAQHASLALMEEEDRQTIR